MKSAQVAPMHARAYPLLYNCTERLASRPPHDPCTEILRLFVWDGPSTPVSKAEEHFIFHDRVSFEKYPDRALSQVRVPANPFALLQPGAAELKPIAQVHVRRANFLFSHLKVALQAGVAHWNFYRLEAPHGAPQTADKVPRKALVIHGSLL
jgi:hypothetical protein